jgi:hypothetical protein
MNLSNFLSFSEFRKGFPEARALRGTTFHSHFDGWIESSKGNFVCGSPALDVSLRLYYSVDSEHDTHAKSIGSCKSFISSNSRSKYRFILQSIVVRRSEHKNE